MECTQCGFCCKDEVCDIGLTIGDSKPCRALEFIDDKYYCGMVMNASKYIDVGEYAKWKDDFWKGYFSNLLGINKGCCASLK